MKKIILGTLSEKKSQHGNTYYTGETDTGMKLLMTRKKHPNGHYEWILEIVGSAHCK